MAEAAKKLLEVETIHVGADKGYDDQDEIEQCIYNGIIPTVTCPMGCILTRFRTHKDGSAR